MMKRLIIGLIVLMACQVAYAQKPQKRVIPLTTVKGIELVNVSAEVISHKGKRGLQVLALNTDNALETMVKISNVTFSNGVIELELAGEPAAGAIPDARGFVGLAFRMNPGNTHEYECIYLRPANGRATSQVMRNHSLQYVSHPDFPWFRLREEFPEKYESYVDIVPGEWIKLRIEINDKTAKLFVNNSLQPNLIVNDLKGAEEAGGIALWLHSSTLAYYRNLVIQPDS